MFEREAILSQFMIHYIDAVAGEINDENLHVRGGDSGHTPLWVLGHLAICGELGMKMLGGEIEHHAWLPAFAPGSKDEFKSSEGYSRDELISCIKSSYAKLADMAKAADEDLLNQPHGVELLNDTVVKTIGDLVAHLMTTHLSFHVAQLSGWRRAQGLGPLF